MAEENCTALPNSFSEAVCIDAGRVFDSCCDRDCLEDLRCYFKTEDQQLVNQASSVRVRTAEVVNVYIDVEPVSFNRGYYSCDLTFLFLLEFDLFTAPHAKPNVVNGIAVFNKKVILYGSEGNVKVFSNETTLTGEADNNLLPTTNMPKCVVQCVEPIALSARIGALQSCHECCCCIPRCACNCLGGTIDTGTDPNRPTVFVTVGLFSIVQLIRNVQMLIPVYDYCVPQKQCEDNTDHPCDVFKRLQFPTEDFFPPRAKPEPGCDCGCS